MATMVLVVKALMGSSGSSKTVLELVWTVHWRPCGPWTLKVSDPVTPTTPA